VAGRRRFRVECRPDLRISPCPSAEIGLCFVMKLRVDPERLASKARDIGRETAEEIVAVHGPLWKARDDLTKLVLSLATAILAGTISFSSSILNQTSSSFASLALIFCWFLMLIAICCGLASLWSANTLQSFRVRFTNAEPHIKAEARKIEASSEDEVMSAISDIIKRYSEEALNPLGPADVRAKYMSLAALVLFASSLGVFIVVGGILVT